MEEVIDSNLVISLLELTYRAGKDQDRSSAETQLSKIAQNVAEMANVLLKIIGNDPVNELVKESASIFLSKLLRSKKFRTLDNSLELKGSLISQILDKMGSLVLPFKIKGSLKESLITLLQEDSNSFFKDKITQVLIKTFQSNKVQEYFTGFIITYCLLSVTTKHEIKKLFMETITFLNSIAAKLIYLYVECVNGMISKKSNCPLVVIKEEQAIIFDSLFSWMEIIELFANKFCEFKTDSIEYLFSNQPLSQLFHEIFLLSFRVERQIPDCIFSTTGIFEIDDSLNRLKRVLIFVYNMVLFYTLRRSLSNPKFRSSFFFQTLQGLVPALIGSAMSIPRIMKQIEEHDNLRNLVQNSLNLLNNSIKTLELYPIFAQNKDIIITELIFPCLSATPQEIDLIEDNPEEFFHRALDVCDKQNSESIKTLSAKILESLSDHIDGSLSIIANLAINLFEFSIESNNLKEIEVKYPFLNKFRMCDFLSKTSPERRIETSLIVLCILNYAICKRKDLISQIEKILIHKFEFFSSFKLSSLLQSRVCLFLGYYLEDVFVSKEMNPVQNDFVSKYLFYLTQSLQLSSKTVSIVSLQALDALNYILQNKEHLDFVKMVINDIISVFITLIPNTQLTELWDLIQDLLNDYFLYFKNKEEVLRKLMTYLKERILYEMEKIKGSKFETNIFINKSWNIIRSVSENKYFLPPYVEIMEEQLFPLFELLKDPRQIDFDEDILLLIAEFIKKSKRITSLERSLFQYFGLYFEKYHCVFGNLFATLNYYIFYGRDFFSNDKQSLNLILQIGIQALFVSNQYSNEANQSQGALIIQSILQNHANILTEEHKVMLLTKTIERGFQNIQKDFLKCQLNEIFLCFFLYDYDFISAFLLKNSQFEPVLQSILNRSNIYQHSYDKKLFVFGMTKLLLQNFSFFAFGNLAKIIQSLIQVLKLNPTKKEKSFSGKRKDKKSSDNLCDEEEDNEDNAQTEESKGSISNEDEDGDFSYTDIDFDEDNEITTVLNSFLSPISSEDEYQFFRKAVEQLKIQHLENLQSIIIGLSIEEKQEFNDILLCQKITNLDMSESKVFRKIVKVKTKKK